MWIQKVGRKLQTTRCEPLEPPTFEHKEKGGSSGISVGKKHGLGAGGGRRAGASSFCKSPFYFIFSSAGFLKKEDAVAGGRGGGVRESG